MALLICALVPAPFIYGEEINTGPAPPPLLVRARRGDTPDTLARRYLGDSSKGWMIGEYNNKKALSEGEAVLVPQSPFRYGGLAPDGCQTVPVLAYPDIGNTSGKKGRILRRDFNGQMRWLKTRGFTAISPEQLIDFMNFSGQLPRRSVLITADTESGDFLDLAVPVLQTFGFPATLFVAAERVGMEGAMTWDQLKQLQKEGFSIGCRCRQGGALTRRKRRQDDKAYFQWIESELRLAKKLVETNLKTPCSFLAYPKGDTSGLVAAMAAKLGFSAAFIRTPGKTPFFADRFAIHRIAVDGRMSPEQFGSGLTTLIRLDIN